MNFSGQKDELPLKNFPPAAEKEQPNKNLRLSTYPSLLQI